MTYGDRGQFSNQDYFHLFALFIALNCILYNVYLVIEMGNVEHAEERCFLEVLCLCQPKPAQSYLSQHGHVKHFFKTLDKKCKSSFRLFENANITAYGQST